jgi:hypothetical protein
MNGFLKFSIAALLAVGLSLSAALAQQKAAQPSAAALATAKEILTLKKSDLIYKGVVINLLTRAKGTLLQSNLNLSKDLDEVVTKIVPEFTPREQQVADQLAREYASAFSEQELKEILAFYSSVTGRKVIDQEPKVIDASMNFLNQWAEKLSLEMMDRIRTEMKKRGKDI